jgi:molybdopterin-guanine dinucleotide biosynthesis protein A
MLTIVIQAGGESKRMGRDKGLVSFRGQPLIQRVVARLQPLADELLITTNRPADYAFLGRPCLPDRLPGRGALGGLYTALAAAQHDYVAVVACDLPFASAALLAALQARLQTSGAALAIPRPPGGLEPFHAVYRRAACLPHVEAALQANRWRVDAWFDQVTIDYCEAAEIARYDPQGRAFLNVNTPEELAQAEALDLQAS